MGVSRQAKACGVQNIVAAIDLMKLIRSDYGEYFGIAVAGHPEGHPASGR